MLETHDPANCDKVLPDLAGLSSFTYGSHYCSVDNRHNATTLACGYFNSGIRVFDIRDPVRPKEIAYYNPPGDDDRQPGLNHTRTQWRRRRTRLVRGAGPPGRRAGHAGRRARTTASCRSSSPTACGRSRKARRRRECRTSIPLPEQRHARAAVPGGGAKPAARFFCGQRRPRTGLRKFAAVAHSARPRGSGLALHIEGRRHFACGARCRHAGVGALEMARESRRVE